MNTQSQLHTSSSQGTSKQPHSNVQKFSNVQKLAAVGGVLAILNAGVPAPPSSASTHKIMDDTAGKAMNFAPPSPKAEVNAPKSHNILVKYTIQPGDSISTLACVFWVKKTDLLKYNPQITHEDHIRAWKTLIIPNPSRNIAKCAMDVRSESQNAREMQEKSTPVQEVQELSTDDFRKTFLTSDDNVRLLVDYAKMYHLDDFNEMYWSKKISVSEKKIKLLKLYERDHIIFGKRPYIQAVRNAEFNTHLTKNTEVLFEKAWHDTITAKDFLEAKARIESSWWLFMESIKEAQKLVKLWNEAKLKGTRWVYNKKITDAVDTALSQIVWDRNDIWPHGIRPDWVRAEMKKGWDSGCELKLIDDIDHLRQEVRKIFAEAVKKNFSQEQIMNQLILVDSRFDSKLMWDAVLFSFDRTCTWFIERWMSPEQAEKQAHATYNWRGPKAENYAKKMRVTLGLMSALSKAQSGFVTKDTAPVEQGNKDIISVKHRIDHKKVRATPVEKGKCSKTTQIDLWRFGAENIVRWDAIDLFHQWQEDGTGILFDDLNKLKEYLLSRAKEWKVLWDFTADTSTAKKGKKGHRFPLFVEIEKTELFILDSYYWDGERPVPFDLYMERHFEKHFKGRVVLNTRVWKIVNAKAEFVVKQKQPTPMKVMMANSPAGAVPVMVQSDGVYKLSQGISTSVVKLTDTVARNNHLHTDVVVWDDKMLFPALSSARIRNRIDLIRAQIDILTSNVTDPDVKARIEKKLGENPAWTMAQNIKLQKKRYMKWWNIQALKNAKWLYALLMMCEREIAKMPTLNKMAA